MQTINISIPVEQLEFILKPMVNDAVKKIVESQEERKQPTKSDKESESQLITKEAVKALLGNVSDPTLWRWDKEGKLQAIKIGRKILYKKKDIDLIIESQVKRYNKAHGIK